MGSQDFVSGSYGHTFFFLDIMGSQDSITGPYGFTFFFLDIMGSQDSVTGPYGTYSPFPISWAFKASSLVLFLWRHTSPFPRSWVVNTPSPGHMATHSPSPDIMGSQESVISRTVYGDAISFFDFMVNQYSVTGPYGHTFSFPDIMGSQRIRH
ncbi:hypothetical protein BgiBS90_015875 [Biomphalaria glabrata]|nr:hypothetical protein BgiBS90_015875 [Biomphalaria glabrata]